MEKRKIRAKEIVQDVRMGLAHSELMDKYRLSVNGIQRVFGKLIAANALKPQELFDRTFNFGDDPSSHTRIRTVERETVTVPIPVCDGNDSQNLGTIVNMSEKGLATRGIQASVGETKTLVFFSYDLFPIDSFALQAQCRWIRNGTNNKQMESGFEITSISETALQQLKKIIEWLVLRI